MKEITVDSLKNYDNIQFVDLRDTKDFEKQTIGNAISIPLDDVSSKIFQLPKDKLICIFCATGDWSSQVVELLQDLGYNAVHLVGGFSAYMNYYNSKKDIYLDYSANTPVDKLVLDCYTQATLEYYGNANSNHHMGKNSNAKISKATENIANMLNVKPSEIIYTSGASESNNLAIKGIARINRHYGKHILSTSLEHSSVSGTLTYLQENGYEIDLISITSDGTIDIENLKSLLRKDTILVCICAVDSELGVVQPIDKIIEVLKNYPNCKLHVDATQIIGKSEFSFKGIDTVSFTAHKFYGLNSCGILYKNEDTILEPIIHGGKSTTIYRSGTPDVAMILSMEKALDIAINNLQSRFEHVSKLNRYLTDTLKKYPLVRINSTNKSVPHILNISVKGVKSLVFQNALDNYGICVSTKSACSVPNTPSRAVYEVSKDRKNALSSWRISLSHLTTMQDIEDFLKIFDICYKELTQKGKNK